MKQVGQRIGIYLSVLCLILGALSVPVCSSGAGQTDVEKIAQGIIDWKKADVGSSPDGCLLNDGFLALAGTTPGDWYPIGLGRLGIRDNQSGYLAVIGDNVQKRYESADLLDKAKATEWHRISLAVLACGGNPRRMGADGTIDLVADGTYNRVDANGYGILGKQGINGFIWGLITLDSLYYEVPEGAYYSRDDMILNILNRQLDAGGWALAGEEPDPDITAMVIQALATYYNSEKIYTYRNREGILTSVRIREAADTALAWLSDVQLADGGYRSWGTENCESATQVAVALCSVGIDLFSDSRFIKNGNTVLDGILKFRNSDGGFLHSYFYDASNPGSLPDRSNTMAGEQALYGMAAILRYQNRQRRLYDFRPEQSEELKQQIKDTENAIAALSATSDSSELREVYDRYLQIESGERSYVRNYRVLSDLLSLAGIPYEEEKIIYNSGDAGVLAAMEEFTAADRAAVDALPATVTTAYRAEVLRLWTKIRNSFDFEDKQAYYVKLDKAKNEIESLLAEIDALQSELKEKLYPFDSIGLSDRDTVYDLYRRYMALSEYDRACLEASDVEGLLKAKTQVDNLYTALWIAAASLAAVLLVAAWIVWHIRKRKKTKRMAQMPESEE